MTLGPLGAAAPVLCLVVVTLIGIVNGLLLVHTQIPSFALTLGTLGVMQAAALVVTGANVVYVMDNIVVVAWLSTVQTLTLPAAFRIAVLLAVALWALLRLTAWRQGLAATGSNEGAAALSRPPVAALKVLAFALSGFGAGLAGLCVISISGAAASIGLG